MIPAIANQSITVLRAPLIDDHGVMVADWSSPEVTQTVLENCSVQPQAGSRDSAHRNAVEAELLVWVFGPADIQASDRIRVPGYSRDFIIQGEPGRWKSPGGRLDHIALRLGVWEG